MLRLKIFLIYITLTGACVFAKYHGDDEPRCPPNSQYNRCGVACERTCKTKDIRFKCIAKCTPGCFCEPGYLKNDQSQCVLEDQCPNNCPPNSQYTSCGTACPRTCDKKVQESCAALCVAGCFCEPGYIQNETGECILEDNCPPVKCPEHSQYTECGTGCPRSCSNKVVQDCATACRPGCFCEPGYILNDAAECILEEQCPTTCQANAQYTDCGTACPKTCSNKDASDECTDNCVAGCFCEPGFVLDSRNRCILPENCPWRGRGSRYNK